MNKRKKKVLKYSDWFKYDKRSDWNRHWDGKHSRNCHIYSLAASGMVCKISGQLNWYWTDLLRLQGFN